MTSPRGTDRIVALDGLRLVAALMVALFHYAGRANGAEAVWDATPTRTFPFLHGPAGYGWLGVELFFLISGFVIAMSAWDRDAPTFLRSRLVRLYPAYWVAVLITAAAVRFWPVVTQPTSFSDILLNLTMLQTPLNARSVDGVYWTLWSEARFYLLFALLVWRGLTLRRAIWFGYGWLVAGALAAATGERWLLTVLQPEYAPLFVAGLAFFLIHRFGSSLELWCLVAAAFLLAQHNLLFRVAQEADMDIHQPLAPKAGILILAAFFALLAAIALRWTSGLRWRRLTTAGLLTYPFYLLHEALGWIVIHYTHGLAPNWLIMTATIVLMLLAAWLVHRFLERPLARLLRRHLAPRKPRPAEAPVSPAPLLPPQPHPQEQHGLVT
jgi:peptidoglycan/LPS O-acetylase OafA/YrhL